MSGFTGGGKVQMVRIYKILDALKAGDFPNCRKLAEQLEFTQKTIQRDVTYMQDQLGIPIRYNASMHGYELDGDVDSFPVFDVQVEDLAALFLARHAIGSVSGTKLAEALSPAFEKLTRMLEGKVSMNWRDLDRAFSVKEPGVVNTDLTMFGKIAEAVLNEQELSFTYRKVGAATSSKRRIQPYHVGEIGGGWYVIGHDVGREGLRTFALQRIRGLKVLKSTFERPVDFQIGKHLGGSIGVWDHNDEGQVEVVVEVTDWVARIVQERLWHPTQKTKVLDDLGDRVELRMQLGNIEEVRQLVLGWGRHAKVLAPEALRQWVRQEASAMVRNHRG
ncbi:WYL domain-containing protein [Verrucomicrobiaceae bacterium N1E253]|uniref:WYL domain-containing protein n=1 Tax=Oceaniferula marina TaxID=2748318 RepID=A0A851GFL8_9BACT|nr:WYL domain-containing protein [Oceaniferula marina]NWK55999.1 WYL domain-containing protein [Oceaniferula marina]